MTSDGSAIFRRSRHSPGALCGSRRCGWIARYPVPASSLGNPSRISSAFRREFLGDRLGSRPPRPAEGREASKTRPASSEVRAGTAHYPAPRSGSDGDPAGGSATGYCRGPACRGRGSERKPGGMRSHRPRASGIAIGSGRAAPSSIDTARPAIGRDGDCLVGSAVDGARRGPESRGPGGDFANGCDDYRCRVACLPGATAGRAAADLSARNGRYSPCTGFGTMGLAGTGGYGAIRTAPGSNCPLFIRASVNCQTPEQSLMSRGPSQRSACSPFYS